MENETRLKNSAKPAIDGYRPAKQNRSARTEQRFLEAAETLFAQKGYKGARVADIIQLSGCSTGSFYHRFSDKAGLFRIMMQNYLARTYQNIDSLDLTHARHGELRLMMTYFTNEVLDWIISNKGFNRASQELAPDHPDVMQELFKISVAIGDRLEPIGQFYDTEITAKDPKLAVRYAAQVVIMSILQTQMGNGPMFPSNRKDLVNVVVDAALGILNPAQRRN